jgi:hypothetical protein
MEKVDSRQGLDGLHSGFSVLVTSRITPFIFTKHQQSTEV